MNDVEMNGDMEADLLEGTTEELPTRQQSRGFRTYVGAGVCIVKSGDKGWVPPPGSCLDACRTLDPEAARDRATA
jgi:hypothetical protein